MRLIGLIITLGAITWVMFQVAGGDDAETVVPEGHRQALEKAGGVEQSLKDATQNKMQELEDQEY